MAAVDVRNLIVARLNQDLIGPLEPNETLVSRPSDTYMTGILFPMDSRMDFSDDDGAVGESEDDDLESSATVVGQNRPCTMGVSFTMRGESATIAVNVSYSFGLYRPAKSKLSSNTASLNWDRIEISGTTTFPIQANQNESKRIEIEDPNLNVELHLRTITSGSNFISTITLINRTKVETPDRQQIEESSLFQTKLEISAGPGCSILPMPNKHLAQDSDEESARLLYREAKIFAYGHQCSAKWTETEKGVVIFSDWLPTQPVESYSTLGHDVFADLIDSGKLSATWLASATQSEVINALRELCRAYENWIKLQEPTLKLLNDSDAETAKRHKEVWLELLNRMTFGVEAISENQKLFTAFSLANRAMALQHSWKQSSSELRWRPFQIAFLLLTLESSIDSSHAYRETLDLLWFPTGGGKTEAYLALIALTAFYRRLESPTKQRTFGNVALMRYTLRLLTAQQFTRAASLILACELIRKQENFDEVSLGTTPFSIGLWVGRDATPNNFDSAVEARRSRLGVTAEQISSCYSCESRLKWIYDETQQSVHPRCESVHCELGTSFGIWPIATVDSDIYRMKPTLVIGTIDKFAQLPFNTEVASLFGFGTSQTPDLVIQDELHLISGPLGTIAGLYETAFDWLISRDGKRAKVIGSTATIRRAEEQVRALFDRQSFQFPPPGLSYKDSGFAVVDTNSEGRLYVGITTAGRSAKFVTQAVTGSVLQAINKEIPFDQSEYDGYGTLLMYFNSLRELGGAIVQVLDDVPDSMTLYASRRSESLREIDEPRELTSHVSQKDIVRTLEELSLSMDSPEAIDAVLATNMVSVGVDVPRLGLMLVNGQPKTRSEYIQSTSRVGRSDFPGLVVCVMNAMKSRDRSHYETFVSWHKTIYRDVEATSVTPFASRARDRGLRAVLVSMIRHSDLKMSDSPNLMNASSELLAKIVGEIERRISTVAPDELGEASIELDAALDEWMSRSEAGNLKKYLGRNPRQIKSSLLQTAELAAQRAAAGILPGSAWPTLNTMRSVEPSTEFRLVEYLAADPKAALKNKEVNATKDRPWRTS